MAKKKRKVKFELGVLLGHLESVITLLTDEGGRVYMTDPVTRHNRAAWSVRVEFALPEKEAEQVMRGIFGIETIMKVSRGPLQL